MGKKLAIKGHFTRGWEVIELLEMLGGVNGKINKKTGETYNIYNGRYFIDEICNVREVAYYIDFESQIRCIDIKDITTNFIVYSLEMFLETFPFKVGDKVIDTADGCPGVVNEMKWDEDVSDMKYYVAFENGVDFGWFTNDSINFFKIKKNENLDETHQKRDIDKSDFIIKHMILPNKMDDKLEYEIIDGYEFDRVENNKIILKPIKPKYPKTYKECCDVLLISPYYNLRYHTYEPNYDEYATSNSLLSLQDKLNTLGKLIICYNAYRKIAGEQMGLDKPWEPAIQDTIWGITRSKDEVEKYSCHYGKTKLLEFPNEEIRDAFYENFKNLIEQCKELL